MSDVDYVYAVARIRSKELGLFSAAVIEQLLSRPDYEACVSFLAEKGWGGADTPRDGEAILMREREKTWEDIRDLTPDMSVFELLNYTNVFHNLKAAVKEVCTGAKVDHIYYSDTDPSAEEILEAVQEKDFDSLPEYMAGAAKEAFETLLHTKDGQLCDMIVDRAALDRSTGPGRARRPRCCVITRKRQYPQRISGLRRAAAGQESRRASYSVLLRPALRFRRKSLRMRQRRESRSCGRI